MYVNLAPDYIVQRGDHVMRRKKSGLGWHHGTGVSWGMIEHTLPDVGKHITTLEGAQRRRGKCEHPYVSGFGRSQFWMEQKLMTLIAFASGA